MPPDMSIQALSVRQVSLTSTLRDLNQLTQQLSTLQLSSSSSSTTPSSPDRDVTDYAALREDLTADIGAGLKQCAEDLDDLTADIDDLDPSASPSARSKRRSHAPRGDDALARLSTECVRLAEELKHLHARYRKAQLQSLANAHRAAQRERAAYLASLQAAATAYTRNAAAADTDTPPTDTTSTPARFTDLFAGRRPAARSASTKATSDAVLLSASTDVTQSLKRTHALMTSELSRSRFAHDTLAESNAALTELGARYASFSDLVARSAGLLGTLLRSQKSDTWFLETALYALLATLAWLLFRRLLYGPLWWFAYLPLRVLWGACVALFGVGAGAGAQTSSAVSSVRGGAASATSVFATHPAAAATQDPDPAANARSPHDTLSNSIGAAAEAANDAARRGASGDGNGNGNPQAHGGGEGQGERERVVRGDGTELPVRGQDQPPPNPLKRDWVEGGDGLAGGDADAEGKGKGKGKGEKREL